MLLLVPRQGCGFKFGGDDVALQEVQVRRRLPVALRIDSPIVIRLVISTEIESLSVESI
jgi:hypothetical protein